MDEILFYELNGEGIRVVVSNFGATLVSVFAPDRDGNYADVVLGYDDAQGYINGTAYHGGTIGRYANRICGASYTQYDESGDKTYRLTVNDGDNTLHGGDGFHKKLWRTVHHNDTTAVFSYTSPDGEDGFPSEVRVTATYEITNAGTLAITYKATNSGNATTPVCLTNHAYYNLGGGVTRDIRGTELCIRSGEYTPLDCDGIPLGSVVAARGGDYDFTAPREIKDEYDNNLLLSVRDNGTEYAARAYDRTSGRIMSLYTNLPAMQFYTGIHLGERGKGGGSYKAFSGFCLEPQYTPDTPNLVNRVNKFPSCAIRPGETREDWITLNFAAK